MKVKSVTLFFLFTVLFSSTSNAQLDIKFGDNSNQVASVTTYLVNQTNLSGEISARQKILYSNGVPYEIVVYKNNITNLFGTLTYPFSVKERFIFCKNSLCKILKEVPEKSVVEIKKAMLGSNQIVKLGGYLFSEDYEEVYTVFLNSAKIATIQSTSSRKAILPTTVQQKVTQILAVKDKKANERIAEQIAIEKKREQYEDEKRKEKVAEEKEIIKRKERNAPIYAKIEKKHIVYNLKKVILFAIESDEKDTGIFYAVPFVIFENKEYKAVPYCEVNLTSEKARNECINAEEILWPSVTEGGVLFVLDEGKYKDRVRSLGRSDYGVSDWVVFSAKLKSKPKGQLLTNNATIGYSHLKDVPKRLKLKRRFDDNGNKLLDKLIGKVDIDKDGLAELVYWCEDLEGGFYQIYSFKNDEWVMVFEGGYQGV